MGGYPEVSGALARQKATKLRDSTATDLATGELVDESISADAEALIHTLNDQFGDELLPWFRSRIGTFRAMHELPATHEELCSAKDAQLYLQESMLRLENLPPDASPTMEKHCWSRSQRVFNGPAGLMAEFAALAEEVASLLVATEKTLKSRPVMRGQETSPQPGPVISRRCGPFDCTFNVQKTDHQA